jgi:hypothetical protein
VFPPGGRLEEPLVEELSGWGYPVKEAIEARDPDNDIPLTRVVWIDRPGAGR